MNQLNYCKGSQNVAQLAECLSSIHEALDAIPSTRKQAGGPGSTRSSKVIINIMRPSLCVSLSPSLSLYMYMYMSYVYHICTIMNHLSHSAKEYL